MGTWPAYGYGQSMRLLFTAQGTYGHAFPLIPLAVAARDAGHDVRFATAERFLPTIEKAGITGVAAGLTMRDAVAEAAKHFDSDLQKLPHGEIRNLVGRAFGEVMPKAFVADLEPLFAEHRPDLVIYEIANAGGKYAAHRAGIPAAGHGYGRVSMDTGEEIRARMRTVAAEFGIEGGFTNSFGDPVFDICPKTVQSPEFLAEANRIPLRPVGWSDPGDLPAGITGRDRSRPLAYLTLGTAYGNTDVLGKAIAGLAALDIDVLVAVGRAGGDELVDTTTLGEMPENVRLEAWVPQSELLPYVDVIVHHGGSGTTMGAFGAGLPQLFLPQGADHFANAGASVAAGVGEQLAGEEQTAEAITAKTRQLLTDTAVRDAVRALADEVAAMPSPAEVVATLPTLV